LPNVVGIRSILAGAVELAPVAGSPASARLIFFLWNVNAYALVRPAAENIVDLAPTASVEKEHIARQNHERGVATHPGSTLQNAL
jgi:hypothetical protein